MPLPRPSDRSHTSSAAAAQSSALRPTASSRSTWRPAGSRPQACSISRSRISPRSRHAVPAYALKTLYVTNDLGNSLTPIDPNTGKPGPPISVSDPYNMYFTPDGRYAIVVAERLHHLDFRDAHTFVLHHELQLP